MNKIKESALELIGGTPILKLNRYIKKAGAENAVILAKLEYLNPAGSAKDRIALAMIEDAEQNGSLKPGATIIEPTSGNTGIGLAAVAAAKGYKVILTLPDTMSMERRNLLGAYGAELVLTEGPFSVVVLGNFRRFLLVIFYFFSCISIFPLFTANFQCLFGAFLLKKFF